MAVIDQIAFRYTSTPLSPLTYNSGASDQEIYEPKEFPIPIENVEQVYSVSLRGLPRSSKRWSLYEFSIVIVGAKELTSAKLLHLQNWWLAPCKYIAYEMATFNKFASNYPKNGLTEYIRVHHQGGKFPLSYKDNLVNMPIVTFDLKGKV
jgi:hypothetical protein